jgi:hypothetical protein
MCGRFVSVRLCVKEVKWHMYRRAHSFFGVRRRGHGSSRKEVIKVRSR